MSINASFKNRDQVALLASRSLQGEKVFEHLEAALQCWEMGLGDTQAQSGVSGMGWVEERANSTNKNSK